VAFSGGPDSTALLAVLAEMRDQELLAAVHAAHVDHGLREGSAADGDACARVCATLGVPFTRVRVEVGPGNVQAEARRQRYAALRREAERWGATRIATGHTQDDQAETVLLRILRGAGARGLAGIPPRRGPVVRPLIDRTRPEVLAYLRDRRLPFLEDPTNATPRFLRNRVRAEVLPALLRLSPRAVRSLARAADLLRDDERALSARAASLVKGGAARVADVAARPVAVRRRVVRALWHQASGARAGLSAGHVEAVLALLARGRPGRAPLPRGLEARVRYGVLSVGAPPERAPAREPVRLGEPGEHPLPDGRTLVLRGGDEATWPLWWRQRRPGDRFRPAGGRGSKKLKAWLIDRKVPCEERDRLELLADDAGEVLWIPALGVRSGKPSIRACLRSGGPR